MVGELVSGLQEYSSMILVEWMELRPADLSSGFDHSLHLPQLAAGLPEVPARRAIHM